MNALVVTDKFAPHAGGTAVVWTQWCRHWPSESVRVVTRQFPGWQEFDRRQAYGVSRVPYLDVPKLRMPLLWLGMFSRAVRECRQHGAELVHCGQILETGLPAAWLRRRYGVSYVIHTYGEELSAYARSPRLRGWMQRILEGAGGVTTISRNSARLLREEVGYTGPLLLVAPGVDTRRFVPGDRQQARARLGLGDEPILLTVARLMRRKGHDRVIAALPAIRRQHLSTRYLIAGTGDEEPRLRRLARELAVEDAVTFLGRVSDDEVVSLMQAADVFVHPNRELANGDVEGFGIVFLEAGACGIPVIGGNSGGTPDAIQDGETGFLVAPNNVDEIADRVTMLLNDAALRQRMGRAGREWAAQFTWEAAAAKVWDLSMRVVGTGGLSS